VIETTTEKEYDLVIVGSGAGGGTVAAALADLAESGVRIALLEWGPRLDESEFTGREVEMAGRLYFEGGGFFTEDRTMNLALGKAYGGSTVVYTGTSLTVRKEVIERWNVPGLEWEDLARRSDAMKETGGVHLLPTEEINENNRLFREGCEKLGYRVDQFPINVRGCRGSGLCNLGCPNAAKQGTHRVQLPAAEAKGVEVITRCEVTSVEPGALQATVHPQGDFGRPPEWEPGRYRIRARAIVLAAGAVHSPALLMRSRLPVDLPALGRYFTTHPALILVGEHDRPISNYHGHPKSFYCDQFEESDRFLLETCMYFPFTTAKNLAGYGSEPAELMAAYQRLQMILVLALDRALPDNRIVLGADGKPVVRYRFTEEVIESLLASMRASTRIFFAAGAKRVHAPAAPTFFLTPDQEPKLEQLITREQFFPGRVSVSGAHLMGGCRMGTSTTDSVTNPWGEVHGLPGLFVADASLFPQAADINPYITIMAVADRVAERVRERLPTL